MIFLLQAARDNRTGVVDAHINYFLRTNQVDKINKLDTNGFAPIHYATKFNRFDIMKKLVGRGEAIEDENDEDDSRIGRLEAPVAVWHSLVPIHKQGEVG